MLKRTNTAKNTQESQWITVERLIDQVEFKEQQLILFSDATNLCKFLLKSYVSTTKRSIVSAINTLGYLGNRFKYVNNYSSHYFNHGLDAKLSEQSQETFTDSDLINIVNHFRCINNHYAHYVEFLILTGCRPEEAIALTWNDVSFHSHAIRIHKAYIGGALNYLRQTENNRIIPINSQLWELLSRQKHQSNNCLVFPSRQGGYINQSSFTKRVWKKEIELLIQQNKVSRYLSPDNLHYTYIKKLIHRGLNISTVAKLTGSSPEIIGQNYLESLEIETVWF